MKIKNIYIKNFKGIGTELDVPLEGASLLLIGPNGCGKTSFIDAIYTVLDSRKNMPEKPINDKSDKGRITLEFEDNDGKTIKADLKISEKNKTLSLMMGQFDAKSPRAYLNKIIGDNINFDPVDFARKSKDAKGRREQAEIILKILGVNLDKLEELIKEFTEKRVQQHRDLEKIKAELLVAEGELPDNPQNYDDEISVTKLIEERTLLSSDISKVHIAQSELKRIAEDKKRKLAEIKRLQEELKDLDAEEKKQSEIVNSNQDKVDRLTAIDTQISGVEEHNNNHNKVKKYRELDVKLTEGKALYDSYDKAVKENVQKKITMIEDRCQEIKLNFKVQIHDGKIYIDTIPIEQLNTAKQIEVGIQLYMNMNPKLKIIRLSNISLCDKATRKTICEIINKNDYQAFVEEVDHDGDELRIDIQEQLKL